MTELHIQKFLRSTPNGIQELKAGYAIDAKRHGEYPNLVLLKYNQIESNFAEPIVQEARGIILDESNDWNVVCYTFKKFHNQGETLAAKIDWLSARVQAKMDGSLCQYFHYDNKWNVATSGTPDASGQVGDFGLTFKELFWNTWNNSQWKTFGQFFCPGDCYAFELCGPQNRIVVDHKESHLTLIGIRHLDNLKEMPVEYFKGAVRQYPLYNVTDCIKAAEALNPMQQEGFVVVDKDFNRIKIKSPAYVMLHHAKDSLSKRRMCEIIRKGEYEEFKLAIESLPELKKIFDEILSKHCKAAQGAYITYGDIVDTIPVTMKLEDLNDAGYKKAFANLATKSQYSLLLFQMLKTGQSAYQCMASPKLTLDSYMNLIGVK